MPRAPAAPRRRLESRPTSAETTRTRRRSGHAHARRRPGMESSWSPRDGAAVRACPRPPADRDVTGTEQDLAFRELPVEIGLTGGDLAVVLVEPARIGVDPCLQAKLPASEGVRCEGAGPAIVADRRQRSLAPATGPGEPVADGCCEHVVAVAEDRRADLDLVTEAGFRRITAAVDLRRHGLDLDTRRGHELTR